MLSTKAVIVKPKLSHKFTALLYILRLLTNKNFLDYDVLLNTHQQAQQFNTLHIIITTLIQQLLLNEAQKYTIFHFHR